MGVNLGDILAGVAGGLEGTVKGVQLLEALRAADEDRKDREARRRQQQEQLDLARAQLEAKRASEGYVPESLDRVSMIDNADFDSLFPAKLTSLFGSPPLQPPVQPRERIVKTGGYYDPTRSTAFQLRQLERSLTAEQDEAKYRREHAGQLELEDVRYSHDRALAQLRKSLGLDGSDITPFSPKDLERRQASIARELSALERQRDNLLTQTGVRVDRTQLARLGERIDQLNQELALTGEALRGDTASLGRLRRGERPAPEPPPDDTATGPLRLPPTVVRAAAPVTNALRAASETSSVPRPATPAPAAPRQFPPEAQAALQREAELRLNALRQGRDPHQVDAIYQQRVQAIVDQYGLPTVTP